MSNNEIPSGRFKLMKDRTKEELQATIDEAVAAGMQMQVNCQLDYNPFWKFCAGIDAYFEKRRRDGKSP
jgi:hypothetical protein